MLHCLAEKRHRFAHNQTGDQKMSAHVAYWYEYRASDKKMGPIILTALIVHHTSYLTSHNATL